MYRRVKFFILPLAVLMLLLFTGAGAAFASGPSSGGGLSTANIASGTLTETDNFDNASVNVTLNGTDQSPIYTIPLVVNDATGQWQGWKLQESATPLTDGSGHTLIQKVTNVVSVCDHVGACNAPVNNVTYPVNMDSLHTFFNAASNTGQGVTDETSTMTVYVPATSYAALYYSTVTIAVSSGP